MAITDTHTTPRTTTNLHIENQDKLSFRSISVYTHLNPSQRGRSQPSDQLAAQSLDATLECSVALRIPLRTILARNSVSARERNVQHIVLVMARVAVDRCAVAGCRKRYRGLAYQWLSVVSVGVSPHAVHLRVVVSELSHAKMEMYCIVTMGLPACHRKPQP
jgi:hypothetical protein